jgi:branched-chain amino acid transport system ATP-binding protein
MEQGGPPVGRSAALHVEGLTVHYGGVCAVRDVSFTVEAGRLSVFIGANGAGKTSTLKAMLGLSAQGRLAAYAATRI